MNWFKKLSSIPNISISLGSYPEKLKNYLYDLADYSSSQKDNKYPYTYESVNADYERILKETQNNMNKVYEIIYNTVKNMPQWNNSPIIINTAEPASDFNFGANYLQSATDAHIQVGNKTGWGGAADFSLFIDGEKIMVDDILEAGDEDFFKDPLIQQDYFNLIRELRNPGSFNKQSKVITLYTARPSSDRSIYENATTIPTNLFLTNSLDRAEGIGRDFGTQKRDIWRIKIEDKYLIETLNTGIVKDFQVSGPAQVPIKAIRLVYEAE